MVGGWAERQDWYPKRRLRSMKYDAVLPNYPDEERLERIAQKLADGVYGDVEIIGDAMRYTLQPNGEPFHVDLGPGGGKILATFYNNYVYHGNNNGWYQNSASTITWAAADVNYVPPPKKKETVLDWLDKQTEEICQLARAV